VEEQNINHVRNESAPAETYLEGREFSVKKTGRFKNESIK